MWAHQVGSYGPDMDTDDPTGQASTPHYEVRVAGHLDDRWAARFDGFDLTEQHDGTTALRGAVVDQAALHGLLLQLRDLGITLLSVTPLAPDARSAQTAPHHPHHPGAPS